MLQKSLTTTVFTFTANALKSILFRKADAPMHGRLSFLELKLPHFRYFLVQEKSFACETRACGGRIATSTLYAAVRIPGVFLFYREI